MSAQQLKIKKSKEINSAFNTQENSIVSTDYSTPTKQKKTAHSMNLSKVTPKKEVTTPQKAKKKSYQPQLKHTPKTSTITKGIYPKRDLLEEMKAKIQIILQESNDKLASLSMQCSQLDIDFENSYAKIQDEYGQELDKVYVEKIKRINEINDKYDYELYQLKEYCDVGDDTNVNNAVYTSVKNDKDDELEEVEEDFVMKKAHVKMNFTIKIDQIKEENLKRRQDIYKGGIFDEIKEKINQILKDSDEPDEVKKAIISSNKKNKSVRILMS